MVATQALQQRGLAARLEILRQDRVSEVVQF
jgi:hypothetical protein